MFPVTCVKLYEAGGVIFQGLCSLLPFLFQNCLLVQNVKFDTQRVGVHRLSLAYKDLEEMIPCEVSAGPPTALDMPDWSPEMVCHLLLGMLAGDGCISLCRDAGLGSVCVSLSRDVG